MRVLFFSAFLSCARSAEISQKGLTAAQRSVAIDSLVAKINRNYVSPDVAKRVTDTILARRERGAYDYFADEVTLAHRLDADLLEISHDKQLGVEYAWKVPLPPPVPASGAMQQHCGIGPPRFFDDSVGYLIIYGFSDPGLDCGHEVSEVMNKLAGSRALILDLRENAGGSRSMMKYLAAYLVDRCSHLSDVWYGRTGDIEKSWTQDGIPGPAFGGTKPLYILTSPRTYSAAEELAVALKRLRHAIIVGEPTGGGAQLTALGQLSDHILLRVPVARVIDPVTNTNWQNGGVKPDVPAPASQAFAMAQRLIRQATIVRPSRTLSNIKPPAIAPIEAEALRLKQEIRGIRFSIDTIESPGAPRGPLTRIVGVVEFAGGRGRLEVAAIRPSPTISIDGVIIADPLAKPGDYYLFDNTGFILVRPATRTFSSFVFARAEFNHSGALLPGAFLMKPRSMQTDTLRTIGIEQRNQHAPVSIHWHMQPPNFERSGELYARGWLELEDAPAIEAGVARWFEAAAAIATSGTGTSAFRSKGLEVTSVVLLRRPGVRDYQARYLEMLDPRGLAEVNMDPSRLVLPSGYDETPWHRFDKGSDRRSLKSPGARWRTLQDSSSQRRLATCRAPWLPDRVGGGH